MNRREFIENFIKSLALLPALALVKPKEKTLKDLVSGITEDNLNVDEEWQELEDDYDEIELVEMGIGDYVEGLEIEDDYDYFGEDEYVYDGVLYNSGTNWTTITTHRS